MGDWCVLYMQPYDNLPPQITATAPCSLSRKGLSQQSLRPFAYCLDNRGGNTENPRCVDCRSKLPFRGIYYFDGFYDSFAFMDIAYQNLVIHIKIRYIKRKP